MSDAAELDVRVLGAVQLLADGQSLSIGGPKPRALLAMLTVNRRRAVSSQALAQVVWNDDPPDAYAASLQVFISNIRKLLRSAGLDPAGILRTESAGYRLEIADTQCDLGRFELARRDGARAAEGGDPAQASRLLGDALAQWSGAALSDLSGLQFAEDFGTAMEEERLLTASARIDADIACGRASTVVGELVTLTGEHPLREPLWGQLVTALYLSGRQADALEAARKLRSVLADELGIDPSPALAELERRVLRQEPLDVSALGDAEKAAKEMTETVHEMPHAVRHGLLRFPDGHTVEIPADGLRIGRMTDNGLTLDDPKVSRYHAQIVPSRVGLLIKDLNSANGIRIGDQPVESGAVLSAGDTIQIGSVVLIFESAP